MDVRGKFSKINVVVGWNIFCSVRELRLKNDVYDKPFEDIEPKEMQLMIIMLQTP